MPMRTSCSPGPRAQGGLIRRQSSRILILQSFGLNKIWEILFRTIYHLGSNCLLYFQASFSKDGSSVFC